MRSFINLLSRNLMRLLLTFLAVAFVTLLLSWYAHTHQRCEVIPVLFRKCRPTDAEPESRTDTTVGTARETPPIHVDILGHSFTVLKKSLAAKGRKIRPRGRICSRPTSICIP